MTTTGLQSVACFQCQRPVDALRSAVKVIDSRIRHVCASCRDGGLDVVNVGENKSYPSVAVVNVRELQREVVAPPTLARAGTALRHRRFRLRGGLGAAALILGIPVVALAFVRADSPDRSAPASEPEIRPVAKLLTLRSTGVELVLPRIQTLVDEASWVHPITSTEEQVPSKHTRLFGAERPGNRPEECGEGHCGVDLDAPRGTPVVAVRPGVIEKTMYDEDAAGGRYVWIRHDDIGLRTEYFHFDRVAPDLRAGDLVVEGQWLGTLGRSGIEHSEPHLHFAVRDLERSASYIDPEPFLEHAEVMGLLDMRLAENE